MRTLTARDIVPVCNILNKLDVKQLLATITKATTNTNNTEILALEVVGAIAQTLIQNLPKCDKELFTLLADLTGKTAKEIQDMPLSDFAQLLIDIATQEQTQDFLKLVSKLMK